MKKPCILIMLLLLGQYVCAQNNDYQKDLDFLYQTLQKTPSYKDQIRGDKAVAYIKLYEKLKMQIIPASSLDTFYTLSKLLWPIKDMHLGFHQTYDSSINFKMLQDHQFIKKYRASAAFKNHPRVNINLDSLETELKNTAADSVEGIYLVGEIGKIGIYRTSRKDSLVGVVLSSTLQTWEKGQLFSTFIQTASNSFRAVYCDLTTKAFVYSENDKFKQGRFHHYSLRKLNYISYSEFWSNKPYLFKRLEPDLHYLYLGNFNSSTENLKTAGDFYNSIKDSLNAPYLIVDLRGNSGGWTKCSDQFFSLIKKYSKAGKVYVLINGYVLSDGERFTLQLKSLNNVKVFGETTAGQIAYGSNYGKAPTLPSGRFKIYPTDMKDGSFLQYEERGVEPDVYLNNQSDWIEQLKQIIAQKSAN
jgi:hypothetical protein